MAILHHGKELSEEELKQAAGGYIFDNENLEYEWEVIDDKTGNVIRRGMARWEAEDFASSHGLSTKRLSWNELCFGVNTNSNLPGIVARNAFVSFDVWAE